MTCFQPLYVVYPKCITVQLSEDGQWMWNGTEWIPANQPPAVVAQPQPSAVYEQPQMANSAGFLATAPMAEQSKTKIVPWIGVGLIFLSLLMPYVSIFGMGVSGGELIGVIGDALEAAGELDGDASGDDGGGEGGEGDAGLGFGGIMFFIAAAMLVFSPLVYLLSAIVACVLIATKKGAIKILAVLHFAYFGLFIVAAVLGTLDILGESFSVLGFASIGFYMASLAPGLWFVDK